MNDKKESPIEGFIETTKAEFETSESKTLTFVLRNTSDQDVEVLSWYTPLEGVVNGHETPIESPCLLVTKNGEEVEYDGKLKKREGIPPKEAFVTVKAGESISVHFDVNQAYQVSPPGDYSVAFVGTPESSDGSIEFKYSPESPAEDAVPIQQNLSGMTTGFRVKSSSEDSGNELKSPRLTEGEVARENRFEDAPIAPKKDEASESPTAPAGAKPPTIVSEPTPQKKQETLDAHNEGYNLVLAMLGSLGNNANYVEWFGTFDNTRLSVVTANFTTIRDRMHDTTFTYDLSGTGCEPGVFAYTYKGATTVWMCESFWSALPTGTDSKAGTVVHELSHAIVRTDDIVYGQAKCRQLAINDPNRAVKNADNHEYCAGG